MSNNLMLSSSVREAIVNHLKTNFSRELALLYPCKTIEGLLGNISDDDLTAIATEEIHLTEIAKIVEVPEVKSVYWQIIQNYPNMSQMYPGVNLFDLPENQLEMLARGEKLQEVLGKPEVELDVLSRQNPNPMDPPKKRKGYSSARQGALRSVVSSKGARTKPANSYNQSYRGSSGF